MIKACFCFPKLDTTEDPSTNDDSITPAVCEDAPVVEAKAKCEKFKEYCDKNSYITKRCQKTCGKCI